MRSLALDSKLFGAAASLLACSAVALAPAQACAQSFSYPAIKTGTLSGKLVVQWIEPDKFIFEPDPKTPLTFTRFNGEKIVPGRMLTDGGSIPRPIWILRNYSPWGFAPAFIVHDWLFEMKQCKMPGHEKLTLEISAEIMAEIMKTMIEAKKIEAGPFTVAAMHEAVLSSPAQRAWSQGPCNPAPAGFFPPSVILRYELSF